MRTCKVSRAAHAAIAFLTMFCGAPALLQADGVRVALDEDPPPFTEWDRPDEENPDVRDEFGQRRKGADVVPTGYPMEQVRRPLLLADGMIELSLDGPLHFDPLHIKGRLRASYGLSDQIQLGFSYGPGSVQLNRVTPGKAVELEGRYRLTRWASVQLAVPILLDPIAAGITLGAPLKVSLGKLALLVGHDLLSVRVVSFVPQVEDPRYNALRAAEARVNTRLDRGALRMVGALIYQIDPDLAFIGESGLVAYDFSLQRAGMVLRGALVYSPYTKVDVGVRVGFDNLDRAQESFAAALIAALRI